MIDYQYFNKKRLGLLVLLILGFNTVSATDYYVSITGDDNSGSGTITKPWRTLRFACTKVNADQGHTISLSAGIFIESQIFVPTGVNIAGAGIDQTIIKADQGFHHHPADPGYSLEKLLINFSSNALTTGNQSIKDLAVDGDGKKLHGGVLVKNRTNVLIKRIRVENTNFTGIWLWEVKDSRVSDVHLKNCAWGSSGWSSGALNLANLERVELDHIYVDEGFGNGIKSLGTNGQMHYLKVHDCNISVVPQGQWKTDSGSKAPNIAFELWNVDLVACEFYNNYVDNTISLVMDKEQWATPRNISTIRVYNNIMDLETRAKGEGYALEVSLHDIEIDHNYILKGQHGIVNWDTHGIKMTNWSIHHNVFYGIADNYPAEIVRAQHTGLHNVKLYNNTIEFTGTRTTNLIAIYGGTSDNVDIKNNLIINSNTAYSFYPNKILHIENGEIESLEVTNNLLFNQPVGDLPGSHNKNISADPKLKKLGKRPIPYYLPLPDSPVIDSGLDVGLPYEGQAPDIGAHETFFR